MKSKHLHGVETLYRAALEREPAERQAFLIEACAGDEALLHEIESLLVYDERAGQFLEVPAVEVEAKSMAADCNLSLIGQQLSHYRITEKIGSGGMGEVYRVRDIRLQRDVAVKVSRDPFSERFEREARLVAALNHPNICTLHDVGPNYLVMELVEGLTLAERIQKSAIPRKEALSIAKQIATALDVAHEKGIVHRDLKPSNIKIKSDGTVKLLDFGLAKTGMGSTVPSGEKAPPSATAKTESGVIMGTAGYMPPEQARGKPVDKRADIWAFGVVLYEMLAGCPPFTGETVSDVMAAVLQQEPDWSPVPTPLRRLVQRCLEKEPTHRLRDIGDALWEIAHLDEAGEERLVPVKKSSAVRHAVWLAVAAAALGISAGAIVWRMKPTAPPPLRRFELPVSAGIRAITMSPDGSRVAYIANGHLYVRAFDALQPLDLGAVPKPQQSVGPVDAVVFWSPDSKTIGFATDGTIRTLPAGGGPLILVCKVPGAGAMLGAAWRADGTIVFSVWRDSLYKVPASGGTAELYLSVDPATEVDFHRISALPDNRIILMTHLRGAKASYRAEMFDGKKRMVLVKSDRGLGNFTSTHGMGLIYAPPGYLLFSRNDANTGIWAVPFSTDPIDLSKAVLVEAGSDV